MKANDAVREVVDALEKAKSTYHDTFVGKVDRNYDAWRGTPQPPSGARAADATQWQSQYFPAQAFPIVQTMVASLVDDRTRFMVRPRPRMAGEDELEKFALGARVLELLLSYQLDVDGFNRKQPQFVGQALIAGLSVGMTYWRYEVERWMEKVQKQELDPYLGMPLSGLTYEVEEERTRILHDDPAFDVLDVRDVFWHEAARDLQSAKWWVVRTYKSFADLERLSKITLPDGSPLYENVSELKDATRITDTSEQREQKYSKIERSKDLVEVLEMWKRTADGIMTCTVGNRRVMLRAWHKSPFSHRKYPLIGVATQPDLFQVMGVPEMDLIAPIQEMIWDLGNQQLDSLRLCANTIFAGDPGLVDPEKLKFAPGEFWPIEAPESNLKQMQFDPTPAQVAMQQLGVYQGHLQNVTSGMPFLSGTQSQSVDQNTATGVSIVTSLAQRAVAFKRQVLNWAYEELACQWVSLLQQYMTEDRLVPRVGADGATLFKRVYPDDIQGEYYVNLEPAMSESQMRQEKRAEAQARLTVALQAAPVMQAVGAPLNMRAHYEDFLRSFDVDDTERYFTAQPQAQLGGQPGQPGAAAPDQGPGGVTSPLAFGPSSPSSEGVPSLSPVQFMQQAGARTGGANNGG